MQETFFVFFESEVKEIFKVFLEKKPNAQSNSSKNVIVQFQKWLLYTFLV